MELDRDLAYKALTALDEKLARAQFAPLTLVMGGGGAMIMAYGFSGATADIHPQECAKYSRGQS
jgi:hypothetical protein